MKKLCIYTLGILHSTRIFYFYLIKEAESTFVHNLLIKLCVLLVPLSFVKIVLQLSTLEADVLFLVEHVLCSCTCTLSVETNQL